ncbi:transmembrane 4 L6 family member 1-like isoform X1 [Hypanus sabinus]|uniref:transmembrane 4 L6 family member 1-like isoform X1 n=1 Tax=Hypanus sabinus TaxID=79690 RepID=UPI0028C50970|nr:transmembrane 4 L6 family member 1-like isoform X1 [Hypanus sabinus]
MCFGKCARCIGATLIPLAVLAVAANILLYFPNGETKYAERNQLTSLVWLFEGIIGAGILMILPIVVFISLEHDDCCGCCGNQDCGKSCAMLSSVLVALIGIAGAGYCVIVSALGLAQGPYCLTDSGWEYPFNDTNGRTQVATTLKSICTSLQVRASPLGVGMEEGANCSALQVLAAAVFLSEIKPLDFLRLSSHFPFNRVPPGFWLKSKELQIL